MICGASEDEAVEVHGHKQCQCGRILDGDCCQGSQQSDTKSVNKISYREMNRHEVSVAAAASTNLPVMYYDVSYKGPSGCVGTHCAVEAVSSEEAGRISSIILSQCTTFTPADFPTLSVIPSKNIPILESPNAIYS